MQSQLGRNRPLTDLEEALLELAAQRGALTDTGVERVRTRVTSEGADVESVLGDLVDGETFRELCRELPDFYARRVARKRGSADRTATAQVKHDDKPAIAPASVDAMKKLLEDRAQRGSAPARLGSYSIEKELGNGALGVVYRVKDERNGKVCALKLLVEFRDPIASRRFLREVRALSGIDHPNVIKILDFGEQNGRLFYAMDLVEGQPLDELIEKGTLSPAKAAALARDVLSGLAAVHDRKIVHRDVKPGNILVDQQGRAVIIDFSVAAVSDPSIALTKEGFSVGTPTYMAPEQIRGEPTGPATDLYALGITLWIALEGASPYGVLANYDALADAKLDRPPPPLRRKDVPAPFARFVERLMATRVEDRFPDARAAIATLDAAMAPANTAPRQETKKLGNYELVELVGRGAHATVYRARGPAGVVALKVLEEGSGAVALGRLTREATVLKRIRHPNVCALHEAGVAQGRSFLALEWVDGGTLEKLCDVGQLPLDAVYSLAIQIAAGLAAVHAHKVVHRDLKPENVLLTSGGEAKVVDFGLARLEDDDAATEGFAGSPAFASPEQCRGEAATRRSDLYALGGVIFRMAAGRKPFEADNTSALAYKNLREKAPDLAAMRTDAAFLAPIVASLLEKDPALRYDDAALLARDLERAARRERPLSLPGAPPPDAPQARPWWRVW